MNLIFNVETWRWAECSSLCSKKIYVQFSEIEVAQESSVPISRPYEKEEPPLAHTNPTISEPDFGRRISVWWADVDGKRWEDGILKRISPDGADIFFVEYFFLLDYKPDKEKEEFDPEVVEILLGENAEPWYFVPDL